MPTNFYIMRYLSSLFASLSILTAQSLFSQSIDQIYVSGGQTNSPYYTFYDGDGFEINLAELEFQAGESYTFTATQGFNPHPFQIGSSPGIPSQYLLGGPLTFSGEYLILHIPADFDPYISSLYFYCTAHTSMNGQLTVVASGGAHDNDNDGNNETGESLDGSVIFVPHSIAGGILTAQDENWSVYNEEINFYDNQTFNAVIENDAESPLNASGSYEYSVNSNGSASLFYTVQSDDETDGYSFAYDLVFSTSNQGTYTKTSNFNGETDITTGPFTLTLDSSEGKNGNQNDGDESEYGYQHNESSSNGFVAPTTLVGHKAIISYTTPDNLNHEIVYYYLNAQQVAVYSNGQWILRNYSHQLTSDNTSSSIEQDENGALEIVITYSDPENGLVELNYVSNYEQYNPSWSASGTYICSDFSESDIPTEWIELIDHNHNADQLHDEFGDFYDGNGPETRGVPVFFLSSLNLQDLTGEQGLYEGNYAVSEDYEWDEATQNQVFGFWVEPAEQSQTGDWVYAGGETEDGYLIVESYQGEDLLRQYFDDNQLSEVGQITDYHDEEDDSDHDSDDHGSYWEQYDDFSQLTPSSASGDYAPESIVGAVININLNFTEGIEEQTETYFKNRKVFHNGGGDWTYYDYVKTSENQATITYTFEDESDPMPEVVNLTFTSPTEGTFDWAEYTDTSLSTIEDETTGDFSLVGFIDPKKWDLAQWDGGMVPVIENGKMKFSGQPNSSESVEAATSAMLAVDPSGVLGNPTSQSPHSLLEFVESQNIKGIELTFSIPSNSPDLMGFGLFAVDYNYEPDGESEDAREKSIRFDIDLWNENGNNATVGFYVKDPVTNIESSEYRDIQFDTSYRVAFVREESFVRFYLEDELIGEYPYQERGEYFFVRAMNEVNAPFTTYLENVRVIRRGDVEDFEEIYVSGGSQTAPYYNFSDEEGPIELSTYEFGAGENYRFIAVEGFNPHDFNIGSAPSVESSYVEGGPLAAIGDELTLSIPSDYSAGSESLVFYCVAHPATMRGDLNVVEAAPVAELIPGTKVRWKSFEILENGSEIEGPWREGQYKETHFEWFDYDINELQLDPFVYTKTGPNTATVVIQHVGSIATHNITYNNRYEGTTDSNSVSESGGTYYSRIIFEEIDEFSDDYPGNGGGYKQFIPVPVEDVVGFVNELKAQVNVLEGVDPVWAEKIMDVLVADRFVYQVGMNNMLNLYFDQNGNYLHAAEDYSESRIYIAKSEIGEGLISLISSQLQGSEILDFESERSIIEVANHANEVFFAIVENNQSQTFEVVLRGDGSGVILVQPFEDTIPWRPVELPENAVSYMEENYVYDDGYPITYWVDKRPTPDGSAMELVAYLEDGREVIFDEDGTFNREFNPWDREEDAKLAFKNSRSAWGSDLSVTNFSEGATTGNNPAYVHIEKLDLGSSEESQQADEHFGGGNWDDLVYRISLVNSELTDNAIPSHSELELSGTVLPAGTPLKLTFTYEMGEPRYILVSGANIKGFKRTWPEWDRPGSFTILAETVDAVSTSDGDLASTFGMIVVMGGERFYNGAIFQANVPVLDLKPSEYIGPYEQVAAFSLSAELSGDINASVSAFLPRDLLEWNFGISEPHRVKAGLMDENGSLLFINGSGADEDGAQFTGGDFTRVIHKGHEPDYQTYPQGGGDDDYKLGDHDSDDGFIDEDENSEDGVIKSRFDFNADGFGDSLLEVRFVANAFPAEVGFGDPYEDPYKDLSKENMGSITGSVLDEDGQVIPEFGLWFFEAPNGLDGPWEPAFFILDSNFSTGAFQAYLPEGDYYVEAWAYNPDTGTPYKPQISESSFVITDASSSHTLDFALEQDFVVSHEYGQVSSNLSVSGLGSDDRLDISIELYPVEQNGSRITVYPTGWLWVEPNGEITGEAPSGRYEVVLFSYDNSVRLSGGPIFWDITANVLNVLDALQATKAQSLEVSGVIYDDNNAGIWADIVFVDPSDEHLEFWPQWEPVEFEDPASFVEGSYRVKIPAGTYKIKAMRWDGLYQSEYYTSDGEGTTDFSLADSVNINTDLTDIDFNLNGAPAAEVQVRIVDTNTSNAIDFAWFAFFDAEDEYGPVVYPHVMEDDGNYSLKLPGGNYKVMVEAGGYEPKFLTSDADGTYSWDSADWASAASISLTEGNTTPLPLAELNAFAQEDHERYAFEWFDEDAEITFGTISGKVVTTKGNAVPKARIVAHTDDYLFWFDHFETKVDGTYELNNLPSGNWIIFAEPPFESEEYLGYRSSKPNWDSPIAVDANSTTDIKLTLEGSNVSGRIMYPKKNEDTGRVRLVGLQHAFLWVFQDENETGEPNYNHVEGEAFVFNEAYGETNEDGFFALSLPEAGKYSMRIELPGNLANLALAPVHFELKNPAKEMRLGNAIRIDWSKAEARATTYILERKLSSASVYTTLDDNISGSVKSYVDYTVVPGSAYDYKLTAVSANGSKAIGDSSYKVSKPFIYLAPPSKTIAGQIRDDLNATITGAEVVAWRMDGDGWANTFTDTSGSYELSVGPGKWEVTVYRPWDQNVNWSYEKAPKTVTFASTSSKTTKTVNFSVNRMGDGKVVGAIDIPEDITDAASSIWIDVFSPDGIGNWANPESNGSFSIPLKPGQYELTVWLDPDKFNGFGSPEPQFIRIGKSEVNVGTISLREFNSTISGVIATSSGSPLGNAEVWAWSETGGWTSDVTDTSGAFELKVAPGRWEVGFNPPVPADGSESPYLLEPPKRIKVGDGVKTLNFTVRKAASKVEGVVYGPSGAPVTDLNAWAYAREADDDNGSDEFFNVLAEVALSPRGTFSFPGLPGTYTVGLWIPPGSDYAQPDEQTLTLSDAGVLTDENGNVLDKIEFSLAKVDSYVTGSFIDKDTNQSISGLVGEVYAMRTDGDGWQYATIETNGTYSMLLPPGNWVIEYYLEYDDQNRNYPKASAQPLAVSVQQGSTVEGSFVISAASASISGYVVYDSNSSTVSESTLYVWAYREGTASFPEYWDEVETDDNGSFTITVLQGGKYEVGVILSNELREEGYLEPAMQKFKMSTSTKTGLEFRLAQPAQDNYLSGTVVDGSGNELAGAYVYAWTYDGRESSVYADNNGDFNMTVPSGALWKLGAEYSEFDANDDEILYLPENDEEADLRKNEFVSGISIVLTRPEFEVPDGISITFDPSKDFVTTLPDGTEITIPGGAANVSSDVETIRLVVTPTAKGLDKSGTDKPADYAYSMELFDDKGKEIEGNFKKDVVIRIPVDVDSFRKKGIDLDTLEGMYYSPTKKAWAKAKTSTFDQQSAKLTMTTDHFTVNSLVGQTAQSDLVTDANTSSLTGYKNWYQSSWLGSFFDASADKPDWVFHVEEKLGWMWVKTDAAGNYWFYHTFRGWLWTGADYFVSNDDSKSHFYSFSLGRWLYFHPANGFYDYESNGGSYLD